MVATRVASDLSKPPGAPGSLVVVDERPKAPTKAELYRALMAARTGISGTRATVELTRNAQEKIQYKATVHDDDPDKALAEAVRLENALAVLYPTAGPEKP